MRPNQLRLRPSEGEKHIRKAVGCDPFSDYWLAQCGHFSPFCPRAFPVGILRKESRLSRPFTAVGVFHSNHQSIKQIWNEPFMCCTACWTPCSSSVLFWAIVPLILDYPLSGQELSQALHSRKRDSIFPERSRPLGGQAFCV